MGKKKRKTDEDKVIVPPKPSEEAVNVVKEFGLCRDANSKKRTKEEGVSFFAEQLEQAILDDNKEMIPKLQAIVNRLTGGKKNGLRIEPERIGRKPKQ